MSTRSRPRDPADVVVAPPRALGYIKKKLAQESTTDDGGCLGRLRRMASKS